MGTTHYDSDYSEADLKVEHPKDHAAGPTAVAVSMKRALGHMGPKRTAQTLLKLNQAEGFDCMSCAWPDPEVGHRHAAEFCENGAKAVAEEATKARATPDFFADPQHRRPGPAVRVLARSAGPDHPPDGQAPRRHALRADRVGRGVRADRRRAERPGQPGRGDLLHLGPGVQRERPSPTSCSPARSAPTTCPTARTCATSRPASPWQESIGIGKASVSIEDVYHAQADHRGRPESRHQPSADAVGAGDRQEERRQDRLDQPAAGGRAGQLQEPAGAQGRGRARAPSSSDLHLPIKLNGDLALFQALGSLLVQWDALDHDFIDRYTTGFERLEGARQRPSTGTLVTETTGLTREQITELAQTAPRLRRDRVLLGDGADPAPQRGGHHQGGLPTWPSRRATSASPAPACSRCAGTPTCRATGRWGSGSGRRSTSWTRCRRNSGSTRRAPHGLDTVDSIRALRDGKAHVFIGLGGNFVQAASGHRRRRRGDAAGPG